MTAQAHTPGPWTVEHHGKAAYVCAVGVPFKGAPSVKAIRSLKREKVIVTKFLGAGMPLSESVCNANLIAAAPDLLAALKMARECIAYCRRAHKDAQSGEGAPVEVFLDAAIAKAEGRT